MGKKSKLLLEKKMQFREKIYTLVGSIPKGKVATYGQIARLAGKSKAQRAIGNTLHQNQNSKVPCHRVVNRNGRLAFHFGFGGINEHRKRLEREGVKFCDKTHVDLDLCLWQGK